MKDLTLKLLSFILIKSLKLILIKYSSYSNLWITEFVNLRVHRNSLGIHLSNLLRKDSEEDESSEESSDSNNEKDKSKYSVNLSDSSKVGLKRLVLKYLGKLNTNKKSGRKLLVTFDIDSVTTKNSRKCSSKISSNSSEDNFSSYSADEEDEKNSEKGNIELILYI